MAGSGEIAAQPQSLSFAGGHQSYGWASLHGDPGGLRGRVARIVAAFDDPRLRGFNARGGGANAREPRCQRAEPRGDPSPPKALGSLTNGRRLS